MTPQEEQKRRALLRQQAEQIVTEAEQQLQRIALLRYQAQQLRTEAEQPKEITP
jgi:hypothetical protein